MLQRFARMVGVGVGVVAPGDGKFPFLIPAA